MANVVVLLASYNGASYIAEQLDTLLKQSLPAAQIIVSDDGSTDATRSIVEQYRAAHPQLITLIDGPRAGSAANFLHLLAQTPDSATHVAFADQDDAWFPDKLERAARRLDTLGTADATSPALYGARTMVTDADGNAPSPSRRTTIRPGLRHALVQNFAGGNTMVMNKAAFEIARRAAPKAAGITAHDWWLYQVICAHGGEVVYDPEPVLFYRQHAGNLIGSNDSKRAGARRLHWMLKGRFKDWNTQNLNALMAVKDTVSPEAKALVDSFAQARSQPLLKRINTLRKLGLRRQGWHGMAGLWLGVVLGKV